MELGTIVSTGETPNTQNFYFVASKESKVKKGLFVQVKTSEGLIIGRIEEITKTNRYFMQPETISTYEESINLHFPTDKWEFVLCKVHCLGILDERIGKTTFPVSPGQVVELAEEENLKKAFKFEENGLKLGNLMGHDLEVKMNLNKLFQKHLAMLALSGAGKCISPEAEVVLNSSFTKMEDIWNEAIKFNDIKREEGIDYVKFEKDFLSLGQNFKIEGAKSKFVTRRKSPKKMLNIKTNTGKELKITKDHPLLTFEEYPIWKKGKQLRENDFIAIPNKLKIRGKEYKINFAECLKNRENFYAVGVMDLIEKNREQTWKEISSKLKVSPTTLQYWREHDKIPLNKIVELEKILGIKIFPQIEWITYRSSSKIRNKITLNKDFAKFLGYLFAEGHNSYNCLVFTNHNGRIKREFRDLCTNIFGEVPIRTRENEYRIFSKTLAKVLLYVFDLKNSSRKKKIPNQILFSKQGVVREYLKALFDCDGYCSKQKPEIEYSLSNKENVKRLELLLLRFGMVSSVKEKEVKGRKYYRFFIRGVDNLKKFKNIDFTIPKKKRRLRTLIKLNSNPNRDLIPFTPLIEEIKGKLNLSSAELSRRAKISDSNLSYYNSKTGLLSKNTMKKILSALKERKEELVDQKGKIKLIRQSFPELCLEPTLKICKNKLANSPIEYKQIAQNCSISASTVSRMLTGKTGVTDNVYEIYSSLNKTAVYEKTEIAEKINEIVKRVGMPFVSLDKLSNLYKGCCVSMFNGKARYTYQNLSKVLDGLEHYLNNINFAEIEKEINKFEYIVEGEVFWDKIIEVEEFKPDFDYVYDLVLKGSHNFLANNIIAHNSYATSVLIEELLNRKSEDGKAGILVIDPHGEYTSFAYDERFQKNANLIKGKDIRIGLTHLSPYYYKLFLPNLSFAQERDLNKVIDNLKKQEDVFNIKEISKAVEESENIKQSTKDVLLSNLDSLKSLGLFGYYDTPNVNNLISPGKISILDISNITSEKKKQIIVSYFLRELFNRRVKRKIAPFIAFIEEAHNFAPERGGKENFSKGIIKKIAREGRKFNALLCLISQRPVHLCTTSLSQCNTFMFLRITNPYDLKHIGESSEGLTNELLKAITTLDVGESVIVGEASPFPVFVKVREKEVKDIETSKNLEDECKEFAEIEGNKRKDAKELMK